MLDFVVWGAGQRGQRLKGILGDRVIAYIDGKIKPGTVQDGIKVISFKEYLVKHTDAALIISPDKSEKILHFLSSYAELPVLKLEQEPPEIVYLGETPLDRIDLSSLPKKKKIAMYGIGLWGIMLYEYMRNEGWENVQFLPSVDGLCSESAKKLGLEVKNTVDDQTIILCTRKNIEDATLNYPANRIEDFWNLSYYLEHQFHPELEVFRDIHRDDDRRLFIIATGPSLRIADLEKLQQHQEMTMGVNMVFHVFDRTSWRPEYYLMQDINGLKEYEKEIRELTIPYVFLSDSGVAGWSDQKLNSNMHLFHMTSHARNGWPRISGDITRYVSTGGTVILSCLQIAFYMGIREIYLLGADCSYGYMSKDCNSHFITDYCKQDDQQKNVPFDHNEVFIGYQAARYYAREHGIKVFNATRGGRLEVFERVDFDKLFD